MKRRADLSAHPQLQLLGYTFVELLYQSPRTSVYRAVQVATQRSVVIKVLSQEYPTLSELVRFRNQYTIAKHLSIAGVLSPLSLEPCGHGYGLVMEDCNSIDLAQYSQQHPLSLTEILSIAIQLATTLHELHQHRVIHKDIKPANILIHPELQQIKLIDFSIASLLPKETQELQIPQRMEGTLAYLAPEQTGRMNRAIDYRTDFYPLGVTLYQLLTGQLPFAGEEPLALIHSHIAQIPIAVNQVEPTVPAMVARIVAKLMAKNAEERYQSSLGLKQDLEQCLVQWQAQGKINNFPLGGNDISDRFLIPEKLYGRDAEVQTLLNAFERVSQGHSELMLIAGFSGIGKTAVVNEIQKPITRQKGFFIKGKFDQFNRDIPFSAFVQAFRSLMEQLLGESDPALGDWRTKILSALGESGQVLIEVIPELEHILGIQPAVPELSGSAAQNRFNLLFGKFIRTFTTVDHPLVIFLDDLQWIDPASLNLFKLLMAENSGFLLVVGAYRDNEVFPTHPLMLMLDEVRQQGATLNSLPLAPLQADDINHLVADSLHCSVEVAAPLSQLIHQKTQGNPFFATQFLQGLADNAWITFNTDAGHWTCDLIQIRQLALTDDVVAFMVERLQALPEATQTVLKIAACMGNQFDLATLAVVCEQPQEAVAANLWQSLQLGLVIPESETYKFFQGEPDQNKTFLDLVIDYRFLHDRVQQAAYSLIPENQKQSSHFLIGQLLLQNLPEEEMENRIFDIVNHLNRGVNASLDDAEKRQLCQLNLTAGRKAKAATAYASAKDYFLSGIKLLSKHSWEHQYDLTLALYQSATESAYLSGDFKQIEQLANIGLNQARNLLDAVPIYDVKLRSLQAQTRFQDAIDIAISILQQLGISAFPKNPDAADTGHWLEDIEQTLGERQPLDLLDLPRMTDAKMLAAMGILANIAGATYITQPNLFTLMVFERVRLSINYGNAPYSDFAYAAMGLVLCGAFDKIELGYRFGNLATQLVLKQPNPYSGRAIKVVNAQVKHHQEHLRNTLSGLKTAYIMGIDNGDFEYVGYAALYYASHGYLSGQELLVLEQELSDYSQALAKFKQASSKNYIDIYRQTIANLLGHSNNPGVLVGNIYNEMQMLPLHQQANDLTALYYVHLNRGILCCWFNRWESACESFDLAESYLGGAASTALIPLFHFYRALSLLAQVSDLCAREQKSILKVVDVHQARLSYYAKHANANYLHKWSLVEAEKSRILGRKLEAIEAYEQAIAAAAAHQFIQEEAFANELFATFYLEWGKQKYAALHLQAAYYGYARWGAVAKTNDLEQRYPNLLQPILEGFHHSNPIEALGQVAMPNISSHSSTSSKSFKPEHHHQLDFASVLKATQLLSEKMHIDDLLTQVIQLLLQNSGADKLVIVLPDGEHGWQVRAIATPDTTQLSTEPLIDSSTLPIQLIRYVKNTQQIIAIDDLAIDLPVIDAYLQAHQPRSILCLPILYQGNLSGLIYLQNQLTAGVFSRDRITVINFLCLQAAISLNNAQLYQQSQNNAQQLAQSLSQLQASESRFRKMATNVPGVIYQFHRATDGTVSVPYASPYCYALYGVTAEVMMAGQYSFWDFIHPEDRITIEQKVAESAQGLQPYDQTYRIVTQSGELKWIRAISCPNQQPDGSTLWDGVLMDVSDRKQAERLLTDYNRELEQQVEDRTQALQANEERLRLALSAGNQGFYDLNLQTDEAIVSPEYALMLGYDPATFRETKATWQSRVHPDDRQWTAQAYRAYENGQTPQYNIEFRMRTQQGHWKWIHSMGKFNAWNDAGHPTRLLGTHTDISDRKFAEIQLGAQNALLAKIAQDQPLTEVLHALVHSVEHNLDGALCSILLLDKDNRLRHSIAPSLPADYNQAVDGLLIGEGVGSCGTATFRNQVVIVADIATDPLWSDYRALALAHGLRASWSSPINTRGGQVLGTFAMYYKQVRSPQPHEVKVIRQMADIAGIAIERQQAAAQLRQSEANLLRAQQVAHVGNWDFDIASQTITWSPEMFRIYGLEPAASAPSYLDYLQLHSAGSRLQIQKYVERAIAAGTPYVMEYSLTKADGTLRHHKCRAEVERDDQGQVTRIFGTTLDITDLKQAELALQNLVTGTAATIGEDFFPALVHHISTALDVPIALVTQLVDQELQSLAFVVDGKQQPSFTYNLPEPPCVELVVDYSYYCSQGLSEPFPNPPHRARQVDSYLGVALRDSQGQVIGSLCISDRQPVRDPERAKQILNVFGSRAAAELERIRAQTALRQLNQELERRVERRTQEIVRSEQDLRTIFNNVYDGIFVHDLDGTILDVNNRGLELFGATRGQVLARTMADLSAPDAPVAQIPDLLQQANAETALRFEWRNQRFNDGAIFDVEVSLKKVILRNRSVIVASVHDISNRKQLEREQARLIAVLEATPDFIGIANPQGEILWHNKQLRKLRQDLDNPEDHRSITQCHPDWVNRIIQDQALPAAIQHGSWSGELVLLDGEGNEIPVSQVIIAHKSISGDVESFSTIMRDIRTIKQTEAALKLSEARAKAAFEQATVGITESNLTDGKITRTNNYFCQMTGYTIQELASLTVADVTHPEDIADSLHKIRQLCIGEIDSFTVEKRYLRRDGSSFWASTAVALIQNPGEEALRCLAVVQDISDRKATQLALQNSQARFLRMTENVPGMIYRHLLHPDGSDQLTYVSAQVRELFEIEPELALQEVARLWERIHPEDVSRLQDAIQLSAETLQPLHSEHRLTLPNKGLRWVQLFAQPEHLTNGDVAWDGVVVDITNRKLAEEVLQEEQLRLKLALDAAKMGTWSYSPQIGQVVWSKRTQEIFGFEPGTFPGDHDTFASLLYPEDYDHVMQAIETTLETGAPYQLEYRIQRLDGKICWIAVWGRLIASQAPTGSQLVGVVTDISDRKAYEERLEQTNAELVRATQMKDEFLATMSHELRTPLNAILGMTEILQEEILGSINTRQLSALNTISQSGDRLLNLINDILDLSKISANKLELMPTPTDIAQLCYGSLQLIQQQAQKKKIQIQTTIPTSLPPMIMDEQRISQVLINLLSNAIKFTPEEGQVSIIVHPSPVADAPVSSPSSPETFLQISVNDTGIGIAPEHLDQLFQPFVQVDSALNRKYEGTGLGLALVKRIVELHKGRVRVTSEVGVGSSFIVELPWMTPTPTPPPASMTAIKDLNGAQLNTPVLPPGDGSFILLVEDDVANRLTIASYLKAKGYCLAFAENGQEAVEFVQAHHPDLILMDIQMPVMDGLEGTKQIRQTLGITDIPIIALTALAMKGDQERCLKAGVNDYLSKPVKLKQLGALVQRYLQT